MADPARRTSPTLTLAILSLGAVSFSLMQSLVVPALPEIRDATGASQAAVAWVLTANLLSASILTPIVGRLGDRYGKERLLLVVLSVMAVGTLIVALSSSIGPMIFGRVVQGIGAGIFPLAFGIIRDEFPAERVAGSIGIMSSLLGIGGAVGVVLAGVIVDTLSYHFLFWLPLVAIVVAMIATHIYVPESPVKASGSINWTGGALLSLGLAGTLIAVSQSASWGWGDPRTLGVLGGGLVALGLWVLSELRSRGPLVDMRMMRQRGVWTTNLAGALVGIGMYSSFILVPTYVQEPERTGYGFGASTTEAGMFLLPSSIAMVVVAQLTGRLERRFGSRNLLLWGAALCAVGFVWLTVARSQKWEVYGASLFVGLGIGLCFAALANLIVSVVRQDQVGVATGMNNVMRTLGGAVGAQVAGTFLADQVDGAGLPTATAYTVGFGMCAGALILGLLVALLIPGRPRPERARGDLATATS